MSFLATPDTWAEISNVLKEAESNVVLMSPYIKLWGALVSNIREVVTRGVHVTIVYGKQTGASGCPAQLDDLKTLPNVSLRYYRDLHAKCYINEKKAVVTSMNLHQFSMQNNREMGVSLDSKVCQEAYEKCQREVEAIVNLSEVHHDGRVPRGDAGSAECSVCDSDELFERLRRLRLEIATKEGVPAYAVFRDASLREMASERPVKRKEFLRIYGVGEQKLDRYGETFMKLIRASSGA
jgi:superfamily II DNA helicase RecQ